MSEHRYDTTTPQSFWYHYGPQGETRQLTNAAGTVTDTYFYSEYGLPIAGGTGSDPNPSDTAAASATTPTQRRAAWSSVSYGAKI